MAGSEALDEDEEDLDEDDNKDIEEAEDDEDKDKDPFVADASEVNNAGVGPSDERPGNDLAA